MFPSGGETFSVAVDSGGRICLRSDAMTIQGRANRSPVISIFGAGACIVAIALAMSLSGCRSTSPGAEPGPGQSRFQWPWRRASTASKAPGADRRPSGPADPFLPNEDPRLGKLPRPALRGGLGANAAGAKAADPTRRGPPITLVSGMPIEAERTRLAPFSETPETITSPSAPRRDYRYIVLHQSGTDSGNLRSLETGAVDGCGQHFVIGNGQGSPDGRIEASDRWRGQRPGDHLPFDAPAPYRVRSIGVSLIGDFSQAAPTERQLAAARSLVSHLMATYGIPPFRVLTHREVTGSAEHGRPCPGPMFRIDSIVDER